MLIENFRAGLSGEDLIRPYLNTGTELDLATGNFLPGINGQMYLNGGIHCSTVIGGETGTYKSGLGGSIITRLMNIFKESEAIIQETEQTIYSPTRYDDFVPIGGQPVSSRMLFVSSADKLLDEWYDDIIVPYCRERELHKKDYIVESPFINVKTMKPYKMWIPTFVFTDSWSNATPKVVDDKMTDKKIKTGSSDTNTIFMNDGLVKTRYNRMIPNLAAKYGLYFICTAHVDEKINMDVRAHPTKMLQYMPVGKVFKNVGGCFEFLASTLIQTIKATAELDSKKEKSKYPPPDGNAPINEVNEVKVCFVKGKNNAGGISLPLILSQYTGLLNEVNNYHALKQLDDFGLLDPNARTSKLAIYPEVGINRHNIRKLVTENYELRRALELTMQIAFIQTYWFTRNMDPCMGTPILEIADRLTSDKSLANDILNTRGYWTTSKDERPYMSTVDVLSKLHDLKSKPKVVDTKK